LYNLPTLPTNSIWLGVDRSFNYILNFSNFVSELRLLVYSVHPDEIITFNTNSGLPTLTSSINSCFLVTSGNTITSNQTSGCTSGGIIKLQTSYAFNKLFISGSGGRNGTLIAICDDVCPTPTPTPTPT